MKIPMETTIDNLKKLDNQQYEKISVVISDMVENRQSPSVQSALAFGELMCDKYSDAFKELAN